MTTFLVKFAPAGVPLEIRVKRDGDGLSCDPESYYAEVVSIDELKRVEKDCEALRSSNDHLLKEREKLTAELESRRRCVLALENALSIKDLSLQRELEESRDSNRLHVDTILNLQAEIKRQQDDIARLKAETAGVILKANKDCDDYQRTIEKIQSHCDAWERDFYESREEIALLKPELQTVRDECKRRGIRINELRHIVYEECGPRAQQILVWDDSSNAFEESPIPMLLHCPECRVRHIDVGNFATKHHHTHSCQVCGMTWRPAIVPTVGVLFLPGFRDGDEK